MLTLIIEGFGHKRMSLFIEKSEVMLYFGYVIYLLNIKISVGKTEYNLSRFRESPYKHTCYLLHQSILKTLLVRCVCSFWVFGWSTESSLRLNQGRSIQGVVMNSKGTCMTGSLNPTCIGRLWLYGHLA